MKKRNVGIYLGGLVTTAAAGLTAQSARAALVTYNFTGVANNAVTAEATSADPGLTAGSFDVGAGLSPGASGGRVSTSVSVASQPAVIVPSSVTDTPSTDYISFTLSPNAGKVFSVSAFSFLHGYQWQVSNAAATGTFALRSSLDGYAADLASVTDNVISTATLTSSSFDLSAVPSLQGVATPVTFRIYLSDTSTLATNFVRLDSVVLDGVTANAVPEPASIGLLGVGVIALLSRRRHTVA